MLKARRVLLTREGELWQSPLGPVPCVGNVLLTREGELWQSYHVDT